MIPAGVIRNPRSQRNRRRGSTAATLPAGVTLASPATPQELLETLRQFAAQGIRHLLVDGGDGTLREVMSALPQSYGEAWPTLSLCAAGNTNLAAGDVGSFAHEARAVERWLACVQGSAPSRRSQRRTIAVRWPDASRSPVLGFFVGCANYNRAVAIAAGSLKQRGLLHGWAVAGTIIAAATQVLAGGKNNDWQRGSALALTVDGVPAPDGKRFVLLATSLDSLLLGLWPFWGEGDGVLRWLDIDAPAPRFAAALPALLRGKPKRWMMDSGAYRSGRAAALHLTLQEPLIIDGEPFAPDAHGELALAPGPEVSFLAPA